jgi:hypothetical protein
MSTASLLAEATAFLDAHAVRRRADAPFVWGGGADEVQPTIVGERVLAPPPPKEPAPPT